MKKIRFRTFFPKQIIGFVLLAFTTIALNAKVNRITPQKARAQWNADLEAILNFKNEELKASFPYVINPFFFEQPLILKLKMPGGVKDVDLLDSMGGLIKGEVSGAFVRGSRRSLLMKNGELIKEMDKLTRVLTDFGNMEITVTIVEILKDGFVLELNDSTHIVDLSGKE